MMLLRMLLSPSIHNKGKERKRRDLRIVLDLLVNVVFVSSVLSVHGRIPYKDCTGWIRVIRKKSYSFQAFCL